MDLTYSNLIDCILNKNKGEFNCASDKLKKKYNQLNYRVDDVQFITTNFDYYRDDNGSEVRSCVKVGSDKFDKIHIAVANTELDDNLLVNILQKTYDRTYKRYDNLVKMVNEAIADKVNMLVMPEGYLPIDWLPIFARTCAKNQLAAVVGIEHFVVKGYVYNLTATILPYSEGDYNFAYIHFHKKTHYAPVEKIEITSTGRKIDEGNEITLYNWNDFWFPVYCCYELASIKDRSVFQSFADAVIAVEWNKDINYYSNIMESLSRDLHCYCIQVNMSKYGDSRITQPAKTEKKDIVRVKGGKNSIVLIDEIDIKGLRQFQLLGNMVQKDKNDYKVTPPDFNSDIVQHKKNRKLWEGIKSGSVRLF